MKSIRLVGLAGLVCLVATCRDAGTGPGTRHAVRLAVAPQLPSRAEMAAFGITADSLRLLVVRPPSDVVVDTTVYFHPDSASLALAVTVELEESAEDLDVTVELRGGGFVLFAGTQTVNVQAGQAPAPTIALAFVGPGNTVDTLKLTPLDSVISFGDSLRYQVAAVDAGGNPVTQFYVSWSTSDTLVARVNAAGVVHAPALRTGVQVRVRTPNGRADSTAVTFIPVPTAVTAVSGGGQSAPPGTLLPQPLVARVTAADALGVQGIVVHFQATLNGSVTTADVVTDAQGNAQTTATLGAVAGPSTFTASVAGLATPATFTATVLSVGATRLVFTGQPPATAIAGQVLAPAITVEVRDAQNQIVPNATNAVTIAFGANPGGATLGGTTTVNAVNGVATFADLSLNRAATGYTLTATAASLTGATSAAFAVSAAAATQLAVTSHPASVIAAAAFPAPVLVAAHDAFGNLVSSFGGVVTLSLGANPSGGTLSGATVDTAVGGVATFTGLQIDNPGAGYTLVASTAAGLASDSSGAIDVAPPASGFFWIAGAGGNWSNSANWSGGVVPGAADTAVIALGGTYTVTLDVSDTIGALTLGGATGTQTLFANGRTLRLSGGATIAPNGAISLINSALTGPAAFITNLGTIIVQSTTVEPGLVNADTIVARGGTTFSGSVATTAASTFRVEGDQFCCAATVTLSAPGGFLNNGRLELTAINGGGSTSQLTVSGGPLLNAPTGTIAMLPGAGGARTLAATLDNQGALIVDQPLTISAAAAAHVNSGSITLNQDLALNQGGVTPSFTTTGAVTIAAGRTLSVSGGAFGYAGGTIGGLGALTFTNVTVGLGVSLTNDTLAVAFTNGAVNGPGTLSNAAGRTLFVQNVAINAPFDNQGLLRARQATSITGGFITGPASTFRVEGDQFCCAATVTVAGGFTNTGLVELTAINGGGSTSQLTVTGGPLVNTPTGTIAALLGNGGARTLTATLDNQGTLLVDQPLILNGTSAAHLNSGTVTVNQDLTLNQSGTTPSFANSGTIVIATGRSLSVSSGAFDYNGGTVGGLGTLAFTNVTVGLNQDLTNDTLTLSFINGTVNGSAMLGNASGRTLFAQNVTINSPVDNQGLFRARQATSLNGGVTTGTASVFRVEGDQFCCAATVAITSGLVNHGLLELTAINGGGSTSQLTVSGGPLINSPTGTIAVLPGNGGGRTITATLENQGSLLVDQPLTLNGTSAVHLNSGTITVNQDLTITQSGTAPGFVTTGTLVVAAGDTLAVLNGAFDLNGGTLGGLGTVSFTGVTVGLGQSLTNDTLTLSFVNGVINGPGTLGNASGRTLFAQNVTINAPVDNQGLLRARQSTTLTGGVLTGTGSVFRVEGDQFCCAASVSVTGGFTNTGLLELTAINGGGSSSQLTVSGGPLVNGPTGTIAALPGNGGARTLVATLDNQGTLIVDQPLTVNAASAAHLNSGTVTVNQDLTLTQSGVAPTFTTTGTIVVATGHSLAASGGAFDYNGGALAGLGTVAFTGVTVGLGQNLTNDTLSLSFVNGAVNGPGILGNAPGRTLFAQNVAIAAPVDNQGVVRARQGTSFTGGFTTGAASTLRIEGDQFCCAATVTVAGGLTNTGLIELTAINGGGTSSQLTVTGGALVNAPGGTVAALPGAGGTRTLTAELDNQGTVLVDNPLTLNAASAAHLNTGTITLGGSNLVITQSGGAPSFTNRGIVEIGAGHTATVTGGTLVNDTTGTLRGSGTLAVTGTSFTNSGAVNPGTSVGLLTITGAYSAAPSAVLNVELGGLTPGTQYDRLAVSGTATLGGILNVTLLPGFTPAVTDSFTIVTCGTCGGAFSQLILPAGMSAVINPSSVIVTQVTLVGAGTVSWISGVSGLWSNPANWSGAAVPSSSDTVLIDVAGTYTVTLDVNATVGRLVLGGGSGTQTLSGSGRTLTLGNGGTITASGALNLTGNSAINGGGSLTNQGALTFDGDVAVAVANQAGGSLLLSNGATANFTGGLIQQSGNLQINGNSGPASLTSATGFTNQGTIELTGTSWGGALTVSGGTLTNAPGAILQVVNGVGNGYTGAFDNQGTVTVGGPVTFANTGHTLSGTAGTFSVAAGRTLTVNGGTLEIGSATVLSGAGTISLAGTATLSLTGDVTLAAPGPLWSFPGTVVVNGPGALINQGTLQLTDDVVNAALENQAGALLELPGGSASQVTGALTQSGTLRLNGNNGTADLTVVAGFTNQGTIELTGTSWGGFLSLAGGTLTNAAGATIQVVGGAGSGITGSLDNAGTVTVGGPVTVFNTGQTLTGTAGVFDVAAGRTLTVNGGDFTIGSGTALSGTGTIAVTGPATLTLASDVTLSPAAPAWSFPGAGAVTVNGPGTLINQGTLQLTDDIVNAGIVNQGTLELPGGSASALNGAVTQLGTLRLNGNNGTADLAVATGFMNQGTIELTGTSWGGSLTVASGSLVNGPGAALQVVNGVASGVTALFENQGTVSVGGPVTFFNAGRTLLGTAGTFGVSGGQTLTVNGGTLTIGSGTGLVGAGTISLTGSTTLSLASDVTLAAGAPAWAFPGSVVVNGPGTLVNQGTLQLTDDTVNAAVVNQGTLELPGGSASRLTGAIIQTGLLRLNGNNGPADLTVTGGGFTNQGTIELAGTSWGGFLTATTGTVTNGPGATLQVVGGAGSGFTGAFDNQGTVSVGGPMTFFNSGQTLSGTAGAFAVATGQTLTVNGGTVAVGAGTGLTGTGTVSLTGTTALSLVSNLTLATGAPAWTFPGSVTVVGPGTLFDQSTLQLTDDTVNAPIDIQGTLELPGGSSSALNGTVTLPSGGVLRIKGDNGPSDLRIAQGFTNQGTIELTGTSWGGTLVVTTGTLTNGPAGTLQTLAGTGHQLNALLDNQGAWSVAPSLTVTHSGTHLHSGSLTLAGGNLTFTDPALTFGLTTTGTVTVPAGDTIVFDNGAAVTYNAGTLAGAGVLVFDPNAALDLGLDLTLDSLTLLLRDAAVNPAGGGRLSVAPGATLALEGNVGTTVNTVVENFGLVRARDDQNFLNDTLRNESGGTVRVEAHNNVGNATLTLGPHTVNRGTIDLAGTASGFNASLVGGTPLVNEAGALLLASAAGGATRVLTARLDNQGTLRVNQPLTWNAGASPNANSGQIEVNQNLTLNQSASLNSAGQIDIAAGRTFDVNGGTFSNAAAGILRGAGTLDVSTTTFTTAGTIAPGPGIATLTVSGSLPLTATSVLNLEIGGTAAGQFDRVAVSGSATRDGTLNVTLAGGFTPAISDSFAVITTGTGVGGGFLQSILPPGMTAAVQSNNLVLTQATSGAGALISWVGATSGNWSNPANWSTGVVPAATDTANVAVAGTYTVTLDVDATVAKLLLGTALGGTQTLSGVGRTLTVGAGSTISAGGALTLTGASTLDGTSALTNQGTLTLTGSTANVPIANQALLSVSTSTLNGQVTTAGGAADTVRIGAGGAGTTSFTKGFTVNGRLQYRIPAGTNVLAVGQGPLVIAPGATFEVLAAGGAAGSFTGALDNQGSLANAVALTIDGASAAHSNTGTISLGGNLTLTQSGAPASFTNGGVITVPSGVSFAIIGGSFTQTAVGTLNGPGTTNFISLTGADFASPITVRRVTFDGMPTTLNASQALNGRWTFTNVALGGTATLTVGVSDTLDLTGGSVGIGLINQGLMRAVGGAGINGSLTTAAGSVLRLGFIPGATIGGGTITFANGFINNAALQLQSAGGSALTMTVTNGTLVNAGGATIVNDPAGLGSRFLDALLDNQGTLAVNHTMRVTRASGAHTSAGTIDIAAGQSLIVDNAGTLSVSSGGTVQGAGTLDTRAAFTTAVGTSVSSGGLTLAATPTIGGTFTVGTTTYIGASPAIPVLPYTNLVMNGTGTATLAGNLAITGNLTVSRGTLSVSGRSVTVGGALSVSGTSGALSMTTANDALTVAGSATFAGGVTSPLSAGVLTVGGNLSQTGGATTAFAASGSHTTVLNGATPQTVSFVNPGTALSRFQALQLAGTGGVTFATAAQVNGGFSVTGAVAVGGAGPLTVVGAVSSAVGGAGLGVTSLAVGGPLSWSGGYTVTNTTFTGTGQVIPALSYQHVTVAGTNDSIGAGMTIGGNLVVTGTGSLGLGPVTVNVTGDFSTLGNAVLRMQNGSTVLAVDGNATFGGAGTNTLLTAGRIFVRGNFSQALGATSAFAASGTHRVVLDGTGTQTVTFASPGTLVSNSHFQNLELLNTTGTVTMGSNVFVNGTLQSTPGAGVPKVVGGGAQLTAAGLNVTSLQLDRALFRFSTTSAALPTFNNVAFVNFQPNDLQFNIEHPGAVGGTLTFTNLTFTPHTTGTGYYLRVDDTDDLSPNVQVSVSHVPIDLANALARTLQVGSLLPQISWLP